jgi:hypothetical protein
MPAKHVVFESALPMMGLRNIVNGLLKTPLGGDGSLQTGGGINARNSYLETFLLYSINVDGAALFCSANETG